MKKTNAAVVLLSGGIDSTTCLAIAIKERGSENVIALNILYGQKHERELQSARAIATHYDVSYYEMDLSDVLKHSNCSLLKHSTEKIKHQSYAEQIEKSGIVDTYVPFRNGLFLSVAASFALSVNAESVYYGAHADDAVGAAYPDCSEQFVRHMGDAIHEGSGMRVRLKAPLITLNKSEVVRIGMNYNAPYHLTWSCYEGGEKPCGKCGTCIDRAKAFADNGITDPAIKAVCNNQL